MPDPDLRIYGVHPDGARALDLPRDTGDLHRVLDDAPLGIYEGFRTFEHHKFLRLDRHLDRAQSSLAATGRDRPLDRAAIRRSLDGAVRDWPGVDCRIRLDVLEAPATRLGHDGDVVFVLTDQPPQDPRLRSEGVRVGIARGFQRHQPLAKDAQWVLERRACSNGLYENLLLDEEEHVLECTSANFFAIRAGRLITAADGILQGVTRGVTLDLAAQLGIPREDRRLPLRELPEIDEAFLTSASRGLIPIVEIEGRPVADGRPGPQVARLHEAWKELVAREAAPAWPLPPTPPSSG